MLGSVEACLSVSDLGVGMTPAQMEKIFGLSKEYATLETRGEKGTGLGLLMCKELVEKNSGKIKVASELGRGSTFTVTLCLTPKKDAPFHNPAGYFSRIKKESSLAARI